MFQIMGAGFWLAAAGLQKTGVPISGVSIREVVTTAMVRSELYERSPNHGLQDPI